MVPKKKRGPAPTGQGVQIQVRLQPDDLAKLDLWITENHPGTSRPEAIRQMMHVVIRMLDQDHAEQAVKQKP